MRGGRAPKKGTREAEKITRRKYHPMTSHELQQACRSRQGRHRKGTLKSTAAIFPLYHCSLAAILIFAMRRSGLDGWRVAGQAVQPPDFPPTFPSPPGWLGQALAPGTNKPSTIDSGMVEDIPPECEALLTQGRHLKAQSLPHILQGCSTVLYDKISDALDYYTHRLAKGFSFCINDPIMDRNAAFDFSVNMTFLGTCFQLTGGGILDRVCGAGEFDIYLKSILEMAKSDSTSPSIVTKNCNDSTWPKGCESGWSSSLDETEISVGLRLYKDPSYMPSRKAAPLPCCEGFFCPMGLSCMIPCPLGAYCPKATLNEATGLCEPYNYRVSPGRNITCGGANFWADYLTSRNLFCPAGQYCPTTTSIISCNQGHYCRQGSVAKNRCFQLVSCDANAKTQNIKTYGAMLIVTLALILLIFYKCSDQVMHIQDRRKAKAREKAVRQVQESLYAADRWKKAANAMKRVTQMISRMSSVNVRTIEETKVLEGADVVRSHEMHHQDLSNTSKSIEVIGSGDISSYQDLTECGRQVSEEDLYDPIVIPVISASTDGKDKVKPKLLSSRSQIMRYAYNRIEKEKVIQNKKLGWEDVLVYAGQPSGRERLKIEIEFQDLCIILKGIRKMILCDVTGKLSPGRVTAVMGPSGAGKTTFLNALAGKAYNSKITGRILINGAENPIHSYKKIIGFVPQDDIVHGNLTVEENLWFSASYRLPVNMPKAETVLVVEHIIESLGLQSIRNSKVGTVEKRGISGGQRKRVNVGLEMVMEPSLLILDEPTSGLDSTSSQLVLKALRREASVGVNVGVVLHQPSYGLFRMFDDVMFLAKGGKTVYLGPVDQVENYFASMKFVAPERINPPDHFMDVLEGIAKPIGDPTFDPKTLPIAWINHKGYKIPVELQKFMTQTDEPKTKINIQRDASGRESGRSESFMQELWREFAFYFAYRWDEFKSTFNMVEDNSQRTTPGFYKQFKLIFRRVAKQRFQEVNLQLQDYIILLLAGAFLGALSPVRESNLGSSGYSFTIIALSLLCMIASLRTFSNEKLQYWRESASGINRVSYFLAKDIVDNFNILLKPLIYLSMFYFFNYPRSTFLENYMVTLMLVYAVTGIAYIFSITMESGAAQLWSVFFPVISTLIVTRNNPTGILKIVSLLTYARWAQEAYVIANAKRYSGVWLVTRCFILGGGGYRADHWVLCLSILAGIGFFARAVALLCLVFCNRNRQK